MNASMQLRFKPAAQPLLSVVVPVYNERAVLPLLHARLTAVRLARRRPTIATAPLKLAVRAHRPLYQGELRLLLGPQRVEGGWWDRAEGEDRMRNVVRDYWVAFSAQAGVLWVFQTRLGEAPAWFLHGHFA